MVRIPNKSTAITWLDTILDCTTNGDARLKAKMLLDSDLEKAENLQRVKELVTQEYHVDVE